MIELLQERPGECPALQGPEDGRQDARTRMTRVLVAGDQAELQRALRVKLRAARYEATAARTGREALALAAHGLPDAVILDLSLPDIGGAEVIANLRRWYQPQVIIGRWQVDLIAHRVTHADGRTPQDAAERLRLTSTEWAILEQLLQRPGQLVDQTHLMTSVWGPGFEHCTNYLRFHMTRLRRKLEDNPAHPRYLLTEHGMGYRYQPRGA